MVQNDWCGNISAESRNDILEKSQTRILLIASYIISMVTEEPLGDQWCGMFGAERQLQEIKKIHFEKCHRSSICITNPILDIQLRKILI